MNQKLLDIYHRLPGPARSAAASVRGLLLRSLRYGRESERLIEEAFERETWTAEKWKLWQENRLEFLLHRAVTRVPYYRNLWSDRRRDGDNRPWEYLENWPVLEKDSLRENPRSFVADDCDPRRMQHVHTSGTTGTSLDLWRSRQSERAWYALFEARCRLWYGVSRHDRWAILGGQLVTPQSNRQPPFWVWNAALKQLYMSSYHLAPELIPHYLDALVGHRVRYLYGYTSALYELAQEALRLGRGQLQMKVVITNAEPVFDYQREAIERAFCCPVRETYGMAEIAAAASECEKGYLHFWPDVAISEQLNVEDKGSSATSGELVCTGLVNSDMPLVRYRVGDRVTLAPEFTSCECGRTLPRIASIDGRLDDTIYTADGRRIGRLDPIFKGGLEVREAQVIQQSLATVKVRYVPTAEFTPEAARSIAEKVRARMGEVNVVMEEVTKVPRTKNGKFRAVVCELPKEVKDSLNRNVA